MTEQQGVGFRSVAYRWLAQFFLCPPTLAALENYRSRAGQQFLQTCQRLPALAPVAIWLSDEVAKSRDLTQVRAELAHSYSLAFDMGRSATAPYASVHLCASGLMYQQPTRDMIGLLERLDVHLPDDTQEPVDHLGIQLHVAAELIEREEQGLPVPLSSADFLEQNVLSWLPEFADQCSQLPAGNPIRAFAQAALGLARDDTKAA